MKNARHAMAEEDVKPNGVILPSSQVIYSRIEAVRIQSFHVKERYKVFRSNTKLLLVLILAKDHFFAHSLLLASCLKIISNYIL